MWVLLGTVMIASLLGSLHCVGMCGPFAMLAAASNQQRKSALFPAMAYSLGRLATYSIVGLIFGSLGMALNHGRSLMFGIPFSSVQQTATLVAGGLMIAVGLIALGRQLGLRIKLPTLGGRLQTILQTQYRRVAGQPPVRKAFSIGALSCLMPCGWLYTFAIVAAGTASPARGLCRDGRVLVGDRADHVRADDGPESNWPFHSTTDSGGHGQPGHLDWRVYDRVSRTHRGWQRCHRR